LSTISGTSVGEFRKQGYLKAIQNKSKSNESIIINIDDYESFESILNKYLKNKYIDAILAADELSAIYTMNILQQNGLKIPSDCSVIGFNDGTLAKYSMPSLTTVNQHAEAIGRTATSTLIDRIEN